MNKAKRKIDKLMTEPTNTDKARYVIERLGLCWHLIEDHGLDIYCQKCRAAVHYPNPTFLDPAGRIQLLELMMRREDAYWFLCKIGPIACDSIHISYLMQDGLLLDAAYRFLKEKEGV
jgi:hypothetical protein